MGVWFGFGIIFEMMFCKFFIQGYLEKGKEKLMLLCMYGCYQFNCWFDGLEKCVGCELCVWVCLVDVIYVEGVDNIDEECYLFGECYGCVYEINYLCCILCGMCIEVCLICVLMMMNDFKMVDILCVKYIWMKDELLVFFKEGMEQLLYLCCFGDDEDDYFNGFFFFGQDDVWIGLVNSGVIVYWDDDNDI